MHSVVSAIYRLVSRIPRGAILRLPASAGESDAAAVASGITGAALIGFRIVGDAATPLGTGLLVQDSELSLIDADISGASTVAIDIGGTSRVTVMASHIHDNPGAALAVRSPGSARITHNVFERNSGSPATPMPIIVGESARVSIIANVFAGMSPALHALANPVRAALVRDNWFLERDVPRSDAAAHARGQRVRFWATPDAAGPARDALWTELLAADVDYFNTDDLAGLEAFLDARPTA